MGRKFELEFPTQSLPHKLVKENENNPKTCLEFIWDLLHESFHRHLEEE